MGKLLSVSLYYDLLIFQHCKITFSSPRQFFLILILIIYRQQNRERSDANPGTAAEDAEELRTAKYVCLTDKDYIFQHLTFEIHGGVGPSTSNLWKNL